MTITQLAGSGDYAHAIDAQTARALTDQIKVAVEGVWLLIERAYTERAWSALGYRSWDDYCTREFGAARLQLPREERQEVVASLREAGLSVRAISVATGVGVGTVARALASASGVPIGTPGSESKPHPVPAEDDLPAAAVSLTDGQHRPASAIDARLQAQPASRITGTDGRSYAAARPPQAPPAKAKRRPLGATVGDATRDLLRAAERLTRITEDDRFPRNREEAHHQMPDLLSALEHAVQFIQAAQPEQATANEEARRWWATSLNTLSDALADVAKSIEKEN